MHRDDPTPHVPRGDPAPDDAPAPEGTPGPGAALADDGIVGRDGSAHGTVSRDELRTATINGARITLGVRMVAEVAALGAMILLTRLIPPGEVGSAAVAVTFQMLSVMLTFEGFGSPLVQRKLLREEHRRTAHTLSVLSGLVLAGLIVLFAVTAGRALFGDRSAELLMYTAPGYAIAGFGVVSRATVMRRLDFRSQSTFEVLGTIFQVVVASALAFSGVDGEALVIGPVVGAAIETFLLMRVARPPRFGFERRAFRDIAEFGALTSISGIIIALRRNVAYLVLAGLLPAREVGYYFRAFQLGGEYQGKLSVVMLRLGLPLFARSPDRATTNRLRSRIVSVNAIATAPFLALLAVLAPVLIPLLFGEQWAPAALPAQILAVAGLGQAIMSGIQPLAIAGGRPRQALAFNVLMIAAYVGVLVGLADEGLVAICVGVSAMHLVMVVVSQLYLVKPQTGAGLRELLAEVGPPALAATAAFGVGAGAAALGADAIGDVPWLLLGTLLTFATYFAVLRLVFGGTWRQLTDTAALVLRRRRPAREPAGGTA
ncbi:oligosaccharide flippase family protein [Patulibacter sp. NPDC049589]|uniref:oligosaccharide flippase family protein n=1 Tax=Patulibacter sp. NPDC049589 TaxID=3154731 RepID=UPI00341FE70E